MKDKELFDELAALCKNIDITIRKEKGSFKSGVCFVNDKELVILNKTTPLAAMNSILALALENHLDKMYIKPVLREFIEKEKRNGTNIQYKIEIDEMLLKTIQNEIERKRNKNKLKKMTMS